MCRPKVVLDRIDLVYALPGEFEQKPPQAILHGAKIGVMAKTADYRRVPNSRLLRVDFPWMEIEHAWAFIGRSDFS